MGGGAKVGRTRIVTHQKKMREIKDHLRRASKKRNRLGLSVRFVCPYLRG